MRILELYFHGAERIQQTRDCICHKAGLHRDPSPLGNIKLCSVGKDPVLGWESFYGRDGMFTVGKFHEKNLTFAKVNAEAASRHSNGPAFRPAVIGRDRCVCRAIYRITITIFVCEGLRDLAWINGDMYRMTMTTLTTLVKRKKA